MSPNTKVQYLLQIIVSMWMATFSFMVIALTWALFYLQEPRDRKGPGINLKEL
jgi:hypothetical protein